MRVLDEVSLQNLKRDILNNLKFYEGEDLELLEIYKTEVYINHSKDMVYDEKNQSSCDIKNAVYMYEQYKNIPIELASEEGFWVYLSHTEFFEYMQKRWPVKMKDEEINLPTIEKRYFLRNGFYNNGLSRLWWAAHLTYNAGVSDPYKYTKIAMKEQERMVLLLQSPNLVRNKTALFAVLDVLNDLDTKKESSQIEKIKKEREMLLRPLVKFINAIGGVTVWDLLNHDEAKSKIEIFIDQLVEESIIVYKKSEKV